MPEHDLRTKDGFGSDTIFISHTNYEMFFRILSQRTDGHKIPSSFKTDIKEMNGVLHDLNKVCYNTMANFRRQENIDFLATPLKVMRIMFAFIVIFGCLLYAFMNLADQNAR